MTQPTNSDLAGLATDLGYLSFDAAQWCLEEAQRSGTPFLVIAQAAGYLDPSRATDLEERAERLAERARRPPDSGAFGSHGSGQRASLAPSGGDGGGSGTAHRSGRRPPPDGADPVRAIFTGHRYEVLNEEVDGVVPVLDRRIRRPVLLHLARSESESVERFYRKARILALLDHPSIPRVHDIGVRNEIPFYTTDRLDGAPLRTHLEETAPPIAARLRLFLKLTAAVAHAHDIGLVHSAIDPGDIVVGRFGEIWITGWASAVPSKTASERVQETVGRTRPARRREEETAPEIRAGRPPNRRTDVWGLGCVLHQLLLDSPPPLGRDAFALLEEADHLPRELVAITSQALHPHSAERYGRVELLQRDIRNFLDGKGVSAHADTPFQALLRLLRNHPGPAAVAGVILLLGLVGAGWIVRRVTGSWQRAKEAAVLARSQRDEAKQEKERAETVLKQASEAVEATDERLAVERELAEALRLGFGGAASEDVEKRFARALERGRDLDWQTRRRIHMIRADWHLRQSASPDPAAALRHYERVTDRDPDDAEAQFGRFLAGRRLPGEKAGRSEADALHQLEAMEGVFGDLARYTKQVRKAEMHDARARRNRRDAATHRSERRQAQAVGRPARAGLIRLIKAHPGIPFARELRGRCASAIAGPGPYHALKGEKARVHELYRQFSLASFLDPTAPLPRIRLMTEWNERYNLHQDWRWPIGHTLERIVEVLPHVRRPEPLVEVAGELQRTNHYAASLLILERLFDLDRPETSRIDPETWHRARILRLRAELAAGIARNRSIGTLDVAPHLAAERSFLHAHQLLVRGRTRDGIRIVNEGLQALSQAEDPYRAYSDLARALADPRADGRALLQYLQRFGPNAPPGIITARIAWRSRFGMDVRRDCAVLAQYQLPPSGFEGIQAALGPIRAALQNAPGSVAIHMNALQNWATICMGAQHDEPRAYAAQELLVKRLHELGHRDAAAAFEMGDPVEELWVRRGWFPRELHDWIGRGDRR